MDRVLLPEGEVHLWLLPRDQGLLEALAAMDGALLSADERARLQSFARPQSARRFLLQRILLRRGLSHYLGVGPDRLDFLQGPHGKPALKHPPSPELGFNLSHCGAAAVLAVARGGRLGVDLASLERAETALKIAKRFYSDDERQWLARCGDAAAQDALRLWALKESVVKALGETLWDGLSGVRLGLEGTEIGWLAPPPQGDEADWALALGHLYGTHVLAVALNAPAARLRPYAWRAYTLGTDQPSDGDFDLLLTTARA